MLTDLLELARAADWPGMLRLRRGIYVIGGSEAAWWLFLERAKPCDEAQARTALERIVGTEAAA